MKSTKRARLAVPPAIVWLRQDLRLADNPALQAACRRGGPVVPVFVWAPEEEGAWPPGGASRWWLHQSLARLAWEFRSAGTELVMRRGASLAELLRVAKATGAGAVCWNRRYEPAVMARDLKVENALRAAGLQTESCNGALLHEPGTIQNKAGRPFRVFTPFGGLAWRPVSRASRWPCRASLLPRCVNPHRCRWPRWAWNRNSTGPMACARPGSRAAPAPRPSCGASCTRGC